MNVNVYSAVCKRPARWSTFSWVHFAWIQTCMVYLVTPKIHSARGSLHIHRLNNQDPVFGLIQNSGPVKPSVDKFS